MLSVHISRLTHDFDGRRVFDSLGVGFEGCCLMAYVWVFRVRALQEAWRMNKWMYVLGALLIGGFAALGMVEMIKAQTPYVMTVREARSITDRPIRFMGAIVRGKTSYDEQNDELVFQLKDAKGDAVDVRYKGVKPPNFDNADRAVVRGSYIGKTLVADQLLLKRPSKYRSK